MKWSVITPVYNGEKFIAETIESVLSQEGDFEIEYIIMDGGSTDGTVKIAASYEKRIAEGEYPVRCKNITFRCSSEKDKGMYDAIEKGFARATGDIYAYINADDKYLPGAFSAATRIFAMFPDIEWLKGINTACDENGEVVLQGSCFLYRQDWLKRGVYGRNAYFIQQDSVFWKRSLWEKARPKISSFRFAGDYGIWTAFAQHAPLWSFDRRVSIFRIRPGQLSESMSAYRAEQEKIAPEGFLLEKKIMLFFLLNRMFKLDPKHAVSKILFFLLFPFHNQQWYIGFDENNNPIKRKTSSNLI